MKKIQWKRVRAKLCACSLSAIMTLTPVMAGAASMSVTDCGGNTFSVSATLKEGLNEKPVTLTVTDKENLVLYSTNTTSSASGTISETFNLTGLLGLNETFTVSVVCADAVTPDEASMVCKTAEAQAITLHAPGVDTAARSAVISGSAQPNMQVTLNITNEGGLSSLSVRADETGAFSTTLSGLAYGNYTVSASYTDVAIGGSGASTSFTLVKPVATLTVNAAGGENVVTVNLSGEPGATVTVIAVGQTQSGTFDASGACSFTFTSVAAGNYSVQVSDSTGQSASANVTVTDAAPIILQQDITVTNVAPGTECVTIEGTATPGAQVKVSGFGKETTVSADAGGKYTALLTGVTPGVYNALAVTYVDTATYTGQGASMTGTWAVTEIPSGTQNIVITTADGGAGTVSMGGNAKIGEKLTLKVTNTATGDVVSAQVTADASGKFSYLFTGVAAGTYTATAEYQNPMAGLGAGVANVQVTAPSLTNITMNAVGGAGAIGVSGTAKPGETIVLIAQSNTTLAVASYEAIADSTGAFSQMFKNLSAGSYLVTATYKTTGVGTGASMSNVVVTPAVVPVEKKGISLDKLYETSLTVVGRTSPNCTVTVKVNYSGKEVSISRVSDSEGVFRIPLPRTMQKHTLITATVTYADGTMDSTTGHVLAGSAEQTYNTIYKVGSISNDVYFLEARLQELGYPITPDRVYDDETARLVRIFQRNNGLSVDGIAGPNTLTKLYSVTAVGYTGSDVTDDYIYLERGSRGAMVTKVQTRLKELGYYTIRVDGIFGVGTQSAVRAFQRNNALSVTGVVNKDTYNALMAATAIGANTANTTDYVELRQGNRGNAVVRLQARLQALGYYTISVDGIYGSGTRSAVRRFQSRNGISASGIATVYTQQVLFGSSAIANSTSGGTSIGYVYLHYGSNGEAVRRLQTALKNAGYYKGAIDGQYYDQTYAAVKSFQRAVGLGVDGIAGRKTQNALYGTNY